MEENGIGEKMRDDKRERGCGGSGRRAMCGDGVKEAVLKMEGREGSQREGGDAGVPSQSLCFRKLQCKHDIDHNKISHF